MVDYLKSVRKKFNLFVCLMYLQLKGKKSYVYLYYTSYYYIIMIITYKVTSTKNQCNTIIRL